MKQYNDFDAFLSDKAAQASPASQVQSTQPAQSDEFDKFLAGNKPTIATSSSTPNEAVNSFLEDHPVGRIMNSFGAGFTAGGEGGALGIQKGSETEQAFIKAGIFNDYTNGQHDVVKAINEAFIRPAAIALDTEWRGGQAMLGAFGGATIQAAHEIGTAIEGNKTTPLLEQLAEYTLMHKAEIPPHISTARSMAVIGEPEANYFDLKEPTPQQATAREQAQSQLATEVTSTPEPTQQATPAKTIPQVAREAQPALFNEYDALQTRRDTMGNWVRDFVDQRQQNAEASAPHNDEIANLQAKLETANVRKTKIYQAQIDELTKKNQEYIDDQVSQDTPELAKVRSDLQKVDYRMRDIAPEVSTAYREASAEGAVSFGAAPSAENAPTGEIPGPQEQTSEESAQGQASEQASPNEDNNLSKSQNGSTAIQDDVSKKLVKAGRPQEEANASAELISAHYNAVSELGWAKGTPEEIYARDFANIKKGKQTSSTMGKLHIPFESGLKNTITLFGKADASTFMHETAHHWLDEMMRYAKAEDAPETLLNDKDAVNTWLGVKEDATLTRRQHEKFARGFERYLMEGVAPTQELSGVFAKFKSWLMDIYESVKKLKSPITDDIRDVFDRLLSAKPDRTTIIPEEISENTQKAEDLQKPENTNASQEIPQQTATTQGTPSATPNVPAEPNGSAETATPETNAGKLPIQPDVYKKEPITTETQKYNLANNPNAVLPKAESKFIDKAGNIRLDTLNTSEDINEVLRQMASNNDNFIGARRGVVSDVQVLSLADALGVDAASINMKRLRELSVEDNVPLAARVVAGRKALIQSATELRNLGMKAAEGAEQDLIAYAEARDRHLMIQETVSGVTAEVGRALRSFRSLDAEHAEAIGDILKENTGLDLFQLQEEAAKISQLDTPQQVSQLMNATKKLTYKDKILEYYINALISGPVTHLRYSMGNALNAIWMPLVEIPTAAGVGKLREAITGNINPDRVYLGEASAQLKAIFKGSQDGLKAAAKAWEFGVSPSLATEAEFSLATPRITAVTGLPGKILNTPGRSVAAIHSFFKSLRYEQNIQGLAYRNAMKEGLEEGSEAFTNRISDLTTRPTEEMMTDASANALKELFMSPTEYDSFAGKLTAAVNSSLPAKIIMPFMKIGTQITRNAFVERTPLGLALSADVRGRAFYADGIPKGDMQLAKMTTGVALMGGMSALVLEGMATGDGPTDPNKRAIWLLNHHPNSLQIGDITIPYQGLGHLGMLMRFSANMTEVASGMNGDESGKLASGFMESITRSVLDENFMRGLKDMLDAVYHHEEYGESYVKQFATNWLPFSVGMGQIARTIDPSQREAYTMFEAIERRVPLLSESLQPKRDRFGELLGSETAGRYQADPVVARMEALHFGVGRLDKKIRGVQLSEQQYDDFSRIAGRQTKLMLNAYVSISETKNLPPEIQIETMHKIIGNAREYARSIVMMNNPDIIKQAINNKVSSLNGTKEK